MRTARTPLALAFALSLGLAACSPASEEPAATPEATPEATAADAAETADRDAQVDPMDAVLAGDWRDADNAARDAWRHPRETLAFFGVGPSQTLVEISPGGGWYTEILAALPGEKGSYIGVINDPAKSGNERAQNYYSEANTKLRDKLAARPDVYGEATLVEIDPKAPVIGKPDPVAMEVVKAFVALKPGYEAGETLRRELLGHARKRLGAAVAPREIDFLDELPRTRSGKIMRRLLKARELGLPEGDTSTLESGA